MEPWSERLSGRMAKLGGNGRQAVLRSIPLSAQPSAIRPLQLANGNPTSTFELSQVAPPDSGRFETTRCHTRLGQPCKQRHQTSRSFPTTMTYECHRRLGH
jgi:hypothetical protein